MTEIRIADYHELLSLHKALMEAKFHANPENAYIAGSPHISRIARDVASAIVDSLRLSGDDDKADHWEDWLKLANQRWIIDRVVAHMRENEGWRSWNDGEIYDYLECMFSPFFASEEDFAEVLARLNSS